MTAKSAQFDNEEVAQQGYLKKLKTGKKRYFVLRRSTRNGKGRLEYYVSRKKFTTNSTPKRIIYMKDCLRICKVEEKKYSNVFALLTKTERFGIVADNKEELGKWLSAFNNVKKECMELEDTLKYDEVWAIVIKDEGIGRAKNIDGSYHLGLQDDKLVILKEDSHEVLHEIHLNNIRHSGQKDRFFFMELGRKDQLGPGELWIEVNETFIAEHMKRAIFGSCNRPRSLTDGSNKVQGSGVYNRSVSQCETNRNKIGSNFGTLIIPQGSFNKERKADTEDGMQWMKHSLLTAQGSGSLSGHRRPATVDFDAIGVDFEEIDYQYPKRLTASTTDLLDYSTPPGADSDDNLPSDDENVEDASVDTTLDSDGHEVYVTMDYNSPQKETSTNDDHYTYVSPNIPIPPEANHPAKENSAEDVYVSMSPEETSSTDKISPAPVASPVKAQPYYYNVNNLKKRADSAENIYHIVKPVQSEVTVTRPVSVASYTEMRLRQSNSDPMGGDRINGTLKSSGRKGKVWELPKSMTLTPRSRRSAHGKAASLKKEPAPTSFFYVDSPIERDSTSNKTDDEKDESGNSSSAETTIDDGPSYVNVPKVIKSALQVEEWAIKPGKTKQSNGKAEIEEKRNKEKVELKSKIRNIKDYEKVTIDPSHEKKDSITTTISSEKRLIKQVSLPSREKTTPELPRKGSVPPIRDHATVSPDDSISSTKELFDRSKTRQGKTVQAENRKQVYSDYTLPTSFAKKPSLKSKVSDIFSLTLNRKSSNNNIFETQDSLYINSNFSSARSPPRGLGKSVSYENLLENHVDFASKRKISSELCYADLEPTYVLTEGAKDSVPRGISGTSVKRRQFKVSKSCDNIFASTEQEFLESLEEPTSLSPKGITYMEVDIERSVGVAEAVRERRTNTDKDQEVAI